MARADSLRMTPERFWDQVAGREKPAACWPYQGLLNHGGYGLVGINRRMYRAHRVAWTLANGAIPKGLYVLHRCDNRPCCNPAHLFLGTHADNMRDMAAKKSRVYPQGEGHHSAKYSDRLVDWVRALHALEGVSGRDLAASTGVPYGTISHWLNASPRSTRLTERGNGSGR